MTAKIKSHRIRIISGLILLLVIHFLLRWIMARSPFLAESYYDEAVTGEMALHILKGEHQLFFWGQPYMGALEAYLNAVVILLVGPAATALRISDILLSAFMLFVVNRIGTLAGGWKAGLLAAAYWAVCPLYLSIISLLATGGHIEACAFGAFVVLAICLLAFNSVKNPGLLAGLIGIMAGLGWWSSLLAAPFLLTGALGLAIARPRLLKGWIPWAGLSGFFIGSLPFWLWQGLHRFSTFRFFSGEQGSGNNPVFPSLYGVLRYSLIQSFLGDWWDGHTVLTSIPPLLAWSVFFIIYLPAFIFSGIVVSQWIIRIIQLKNPIRKPVDLVVAVLWVLLFIFAVSEPGAHGSLRYSLALYLPMTVLVALWLGRIYKLNRFAGHGILIGLVLFNLFLHYLFLNEFKNQPSRPIDPLIQALKANGIRYAYADNRISQVLSFESGEAIICADYFGQRNFNYLRAVDAAPIREVALVTHKVLGKPYPETMAAALRLLGGSCERKEVGPFVFWYNFKEPPDHLNPLPPKDWKITANQGEGQTDLLKDRDILTSWKILKKAGDFIAIDLGRSKTVARISILPGPFGYGLPSGLKVELSQDQNKWEKIAELSPNDMLGGLYWYKGRPRLDQNPRLQISFPPRPARFIRLTNLTTPASPEEQNEPWSIAELFIYEAVSNPVAPSPKAQNSFLRGVRALDHWMDDPTGPHPLFPNVDLTLRQKQVDWKLVIDSLQEAIQEAPDWEEPYQLFGEAVDWGELWNKGGKKKKAFNIGTLFPSKDLLKIPPAKIKVFSNVNNSQANLANDGDPFTRWGSSRGQEPGMVFQINLENPYAVNGFSLFYGSSLNDYPRGLNILGSINGQEWQTIRAESHTEYSFAENQIFKKTYYTFPPVSIRYLKLVQTGKDPVFWWSIYELEVFGQKVIGNLSQHR